MLSPDIRKYIDTASDIHDLDLRVRRVLHHYPSLPTTAQDSLKASFARRKMEIARDQFIKNIELMFSKDYCVAQYDRASGDSQHKGIADLLSVIEHYETRTDLISEFSRGIEAANSIGELDKLLNSFLENNKVPSDIPRTLRPYLILGTMMENFLRKRLNFVRSQVTDELIETQNLESAMALFTELTGDEFMDAIDDIITEFTAAKKLERQAETFVARNASPAEFKSLAASFRMEARVDVIHCIFVNEKIRNLFTHSY